MFGLGSTDDIKPNDLLQKLTRRAERMDPAQQAQTFVALGGMQHSLLNAENRVVFGRRGTGKTHIMSFVADAARKRNDIAIQIDLRSVGSNSYIYADESLSISERATRLLKDFVAALHERMLEEITAPSFRFSASRLSGPLDRIGSSVKEILVKESVEITRSRDGSVEANVEATGKAKLTAILPSGEMSGKGSIKGSKGSSEEITETSHPRLSINIGQVSRSFSEFASVFDNRVWILLDEWSSLPDKLQPYLADFVKRCLFPISSYTIHIAAIERRSVFRIGEGAETIGIELGSDAAADINLDDYLVFENNPLRSIHFFQEMLFRHVISVAEDQKLPFRTSDQFVAAVFTLVPTFRELVRACEGVPRDAINILQLAATYAQDDKISVPHIRLAAKDWYDRDKAAYLQTEPNAERMLQWIIQIVIRKRKVRAFLVAANARDEYLERLFDERILHIAKRSYSAKHDPTTRYRIWKIDYGCYVDRINTSQAPLGFLLQEQDVRDESFVVPEDDFRQIRHAVLDLEQYGVWVDVDPEQQSDLDDDEESTSPDTVSPRSTAMTKGQAEELLTKIDPRSARFLRKIAANNGKMTWEEMRSIFGIRGRTDWASYSGSYGRGITRAFRHLLKDRSASLVWWIDEDWENEPWGSDLVAVYVDGPALQALREASGQVVSI